MSAFVHVPCNIPTTHFVARSVTDVDGDVFNKIRHLFGAVRLEQVNVLQAAAFCKAQKKNNPGPWGHLRSESFQSELRQPWCPWDEKAPSAVVQQSNCIAATTQMIATAVNQWRCL